MSGAAPVGDRDAALIVEAALAAVFDPAVVRQLRPDSPLAALPMTAADAVAVADAVADAAAAMGWRSRLADADLADPGSVADLVAVVAGSLSRPETPA